MAMIRIDTFRGQIPSYSPNLLPDTAATLAIDCHFDDGILNPIEQNSGTGKLVPSSTKTMFLYEDQYWFTWSDDVEAVKSPVAKDPYRRVYFTDGVYPKVTYNTIFNGSGRLPAASYQLGVPAPANAPMITSFTPPADQESAVTIFYLLTYVTGIGEEGAPGPVSAEVECHPVGVDNGNGGVGQVVLSLQPPGTNRSNIERMRIYRTVTGAGQTEFLLVADIPISQATYTDQIPDGNLGTILETESYSMPPESMRGICNMANGIIAGFDENQILFSEPYLPYAWPEEYRQSVESDIVAIAPIGTSLVVGTKGDPYLFTGISPGNIAGQKLEIAQACVSARSMVNIGPAVIYACPDGLVAVAPDGVRLVTENIITPMQWRKMLDPSTIRAFRHEAKYVAIHSGGAFIFDVTNGDFRKLNDSWKAGYTNPVDDSLFILKDTEVLQFRGSQQKKNLTWKSKIFDAISKSFSCARIISDDISKVSFRLIVDNHEVMSIPAGSVQQTFTLPSVLGDKWQFEIQSSSRIESVKIATSKQELRQ